MWNSSPVTHNPPTDQGLPGLLVFEWFSTTNIDQGFSTLLSLQLHGILNAEWFARTQDWKYLVSRVAVNLLANIGQNFFYSVVACSHISIINAEWFAENSGLKYSVSKVAAKPLASIDQNLFYSAVACSHISITYAEWFAENSGLKIFCVKSCDRWQLLCKKISQSPVGRFEHLTMILQLWRQESVIQRAS